MYQFLPGISGISYLGGCQKQLPEKGKFLDYLVEKLDDCQNIKGRFCKNFILKQQPQKFEWGEDENLCGSNSKAYRYG